MGFMEIFYLRRSTSSYHQIDHQRHPRVIYPGGKLAVRKSTSTAFAKLNITVFIKLTRMPKISNISGSLVNTAAAFIDIRWSIG